MRFETLARELVRALRGRRSQRALSRRLGYRTNVLYTWEAGLRWPGVTELVRLAKRTGVDVRAALRTFYSVTPPWLEAVNPRSEKFVRSLLEDLRGRARIGTLAERTGVSRHAIGRWLAGRAEPSLPELLAFVEASSLRVLDFVAGFVDPAALPSVAASWAELGVRRRIAWEEPWSHAVLRALEIEDYRSCAGHEPGWIARRIGISLEDETRCLQALEAAGLVRWDGARWTLGAEASVDSRAAPDEARRALKMHWARAGLDRVERGAPGLYSYNVFCVSRADLEKLREMHVQYFDAVRRVVASSTPSQCVVVANLQLFEL